MNTLELCVWLNGIEGQSAELLKDISEDLEAEEIARQLEKEALLAPKALQTMKSLLAKDWAKAEIDRAYKADVTPVSWFSDDYPERLRLIAEPPLLLYVKGKLPSFEQSYAIVGTRHCTPYGAKVAEQLAAAMASAGLTVVSGGAMGVDGAAHSGALFGGGATAAVLGTGADMIWPRGHEELFDNIVQSGGALISEYPMGTVGRPWRFPRRNRIVVGLVKGVIVVEAPLKSGAMITARMAMEAGRDLWAVPGRIDELVCQGSNRLILEGASPMVSVKEFVEHLGGFGQLELFKPVELTDEERRIVDCLSMQGDLTIDQIAGRTAIPVALLMQLITELQSCSMIYPSGGGRWRATPN